MTTGVRNGCRCGIAAGGLVGHAGSLIALLLGLLLDARAAAPLFPDDPPRAALILVSAPDANGDITVTGTPGAVTGGDSVILVTLDTGHFAQTQASVGGSFSTSLFAPPGTSVLIKADPTGTVFQKLLAGDLSALGPLTGTVLRVPDPPSTTAGVAFGGAGPTGESGPPLPAWTFQGAINTQTPQPGDTLRVQGTLRIVSAALQAAGAMQAETRLSLERLSGPDGIGTLAQNFFASALLTPTGLPIERFPKSAGGLGSFARLDLPRVAADRAEVSIDLSVSIPGDLLAGLYRPFITVAFDGVPSESPPSRPVLTLFQGRRPLNVHNFAISTYLPIVRVGNPAPPRLFWTLLTDALSNGTRGVRALEDRERFGVASRILTQSETFIVPRLDPASGQPIRYRLEPFALTVSVGDRGDPFNPPLIPFRFPSGQLTVRVERPDGSVEVLGPAPFVQSRVRSLADRDGRLLDIGGGHITDAYQLGTLDPRFEVEFTQDGRHVITMDGTIEDIWGNTWTGGGTYEVHVARPLALDTAVLPGTPFEVGDVFDLGMILSPPVPADVEVRFRLAPDSDPGQMVDRTVRTRANRFGYVHPLAGGFLLDRPGEYRVDVTATFRDEQGGLWMGARTWGGVVARRDAMIVAHGRRGIDEQPTLGRPQWFFRSQIGIPPGGSHVPFPFNSGDVAWQQESDAARPQVSFQDPIGSIAALLAARCCLGGLEQFTVGEGILLSSRADDLDPHLDPSRVDLWAYSYASVQRPLVRVREVIGEDIGNAYWRFDDEYAGQIGVGRNGDLPNEFKFQYSGVVLRGPALPRPEYAIYGSLFVLVPDSDPRGGTRTFPPFQGNGGGPSGGPIMTLKGREIDLFLHLTGVRPGTVLEVGDAFSLSGAVGPPLPARVSYTVTKPSGQRLSFSDRANHVGYYYHPEHDFLVGEPGLYTVDLQVVYDGLTSAGPVTPPFPTGDVLGTAGGRFVVYVVPLNSAPLETTLPRTALLPPPAPLDVAANAPTGTTVSRSHVTTTMPGFVLESRDLVAGTPVGYRYDPVALSTDFPNLDVSYQGQPDAADVIHVTLLASGTGADGTPTHAARILALHGPELINLPVPSNLPPLPRFTVGVTRTGTGTGTVASVPPGIDCGTDCAAVYTAGTLVRLTAAPGTDSLFAGWSGGACRGTGACAVTVTGDTTVTATFNLVERFSLAVSRRGGGSGTVTSVPPGIDCGTDCTEAYPDGTVVTLTAAPDGDHRFVGWSGGGCRGTGPCVVTVSAPSTVVAFFARPGQAVILAPLDGSRFPLSVPTPVTFEWTALEGAAGYGFEFTGPNREFANPNGTAPDPLNGCGGLGGCLLVPGTRFEPLLGSAIPSGRYQVRVIGLSADGGVVGSFSDAVALLVGAAAIPPSARPTITAPLAGSRLRRGSPATFEWTAVAGVAQYLFELPGRGASSRCPTQSRWTIPARRGAPRSRGRASRSSSRPRSPQASTKCE